MEMDISKLIGEAVKKLESNPALLKQFQTQPVKALESILGVDLPDDKIQPLIDGIKVKLASRDVASKLGGLADLLK